MNNLFDKTYLSSDFSVNEKCLFEFVNNYETLELFDNFFVQISSNCKFDIKTRMCIFYLFLISISSTLHHKNSNANQKSSDISFSKRHRYFSYLFPIRHSKNNLNTQIFPRLQTLNNETDDLSNSDNNMSNLVNTETNTTPESSPSQFSKTFPFTATNSIEITTSTQSPSPSVTEAILPTQSTLFPSETIPEPTKMATPTPTPIPTQSFPETPSASSIPSRTQTQKDEDEEEERKQNYFMATIIAVFVFFIIVVVSVYVYCRRKLEEEQNPEYTKAILGDDAFEFSQLQTL